MLKKVSPNKDRKDNGMDYFEKAKTGEAIYPRSRWSMAEFEKAKETDSITFVIDLLRELDSLCDKYPLNQKIRDALQELEQVKKGFYQMIIDKLPKTPRSRNNGYWYDTGEPGFWTNGSMIMCPTEEDANMMAEFLKDVFGEQENVSVLTGYYDPVEDAENEETDECSGFWYVDIE